MRFPITAVLASTTLTLAAGSTGHADELPALVLPTTAALAIIDAPKPEAESRATPSRTRFVASVAGTRPAPPSFVPPRVHIPDLYNVDFERDPARFAAPVDGDRYFAFEVVKPTVRRPRVAVTYDKESLPLGDGSDRVSLELRLGF